MKIRIFSLLRLFCAIVLIGISGQLAFGQTNLALNKTATQSSVNEWREANLKGTPEHAVDGDTNGGGLGKIAETLYGQNDSWFEVDLGNFYKIDEIKIYPRTDCCQNMFNSAYVIVTDQAIGNTPVVDGARIVYSSTFSKFQDPIYEAGNKARTIPVNGSVGRFVRLQIKGWGAIQLAEIEVFGDPTPVAGHTPNSNKAWNAPFVAAFDPNYPDFQGATGEYLRTLEASPKIVGVKNPDNSFDIAFQDTNSKLIRVNTYERQGLGFSKKTGTTLNLTGEGVFGGFAKDANLNRYIFTGTPWSRRGEAGISKVYKNNQVLWDGKFYNNDNGSIGNVESFMHYGGSRLVVGGDSLLITTNIAPAHPYQVILDTKDTINKNSNRVFFESQFQHNFGQRAIFDGSDFVIMENRDHDVSVTLSKLKPSDVLPLGGKNEGHALEYVKRIFSVYSHTNFGNNTYTELGNVEKGLNDDGYLVLFAGERDWNNKMNGYNYNQSNWAPQILSPRDIGLIHVRKDFNTIAKDVNWLNTKGEKSQCPVKVDNSTFVNSSGTTKIVKYKAANDGWDWTNYNKTCQAEINAGQTERTLVSNGVKWITTFGTSYESNKIKATGEFTSVNHPKLVRIDKNKNQYIVLWEEWKANSDGQGQPKKEYLTTKAALITLKAAPNGEVNIELTLAPTDLGKVRLMPGDDAFEFDGKAAWAVGDITKGKMMFYTVDSDLKLSSSALEL